LKKTGEKKMGEQEEPGSSTKTYSLQSYPPQENEYEIRGVEHLLYELTDYKVRTIQTKTTPDLNELFTED
jgi:hypothetical protein